MSNRGIVSNLSCPKKTSSIFESIPGWSHTIKNDTDKKAVILVWSNEVFKKNKPDTYKYKINVND